MEQTVKVLKTLIRRECFWLRKKKESFYNKKIAVFTAGPTAQRFCSVLENDYGITVDFFIDNDPKLNRSLILGKPIYYEPWKQQPDFAKEYVVIVASSHLNYSIISAQLESTGIDLHMSHYQFEGSSLLDRYMAVFDMLDNDLSKCSYLSAIYAMLTGDYHLLLTNPDQYFGHPAFMNSSHQIIVDAGAYVGDSFDEYISRSLGTIKIYAFEPFDECCSAMEARKRRLTEEWLLDEDQITIIKSCVGDSSNNAFTMSSGSTNGTMRKDDNAKSTFPSISLDEFFENKENPTLIKADVEGMEMNMLHGGVQIISDTKPKMALSIYHNPLDMAQIAEFAVSLVPEYQLAVRCHKDNFDDIILYCWVD